MQNKEPFVVNRIINQTHRFFVGQDNETKEYYIAKPGHNGPIITTFLQKIPEEDYLLMRSDPEALREKYKEFLNAKAS